MLRQITLGQAGMTREIVQVRLRHAAVEIDPAGFIFRQQNDVVGGHLPDPGIVRPAPGVHLIQILYLQVAQHADETQEDIRRAGRVIHCPVMMAQIDVQGFCHIIQLIFADPGKKNPRKSHGINRSEIMRKAQPVTVLLDKTDVEGGIVRYKHRAFTESQKTREDLLNGLRLYDHGVADARQLLDPEGNRDFGVYKFRETIRDFSVFHLHGADLDDPVFNRRKSRRLYVKDDEAAGQLLPLRIDGGFHLVVHQIGLAAVDDLEIRIRRHGVPCVRKRLNHAVVRDGDRFMPPGSGRFYDGLHIADRVHRAHLRMAVQLHPLLRPGVHAAHPEIRRLFDSVDVRDHNIRIIHVLGRHAFYPDKAPGLQRRGQFPPERRIQEQLDVHRIREVGHADDYQVQVAAFLRMDLPDIDRRNLPSDRDIPDRAENRLHLDRIIVKILSVYHIRIVRPAERLRAALFPAPCSFAPAGVSFHGSPAAGVFYRTAS